MELIKIIMFNYFKYNILVVLITYWWKLGIGDWGLGIGDWGLGIGPNPQSPNPQSPYAFKI
jgi:hypothetical protein